MFRPQHETLRISLDEKRDDENYLSAMHGNANKTIPTSCNEYIEFDINGIYIKIDPDILAWFNERYNDIAVAINTVLRKHIKDTMSSN
jgi:uncharacterized protein (DUF4415 family)